MEHREEKILLVETDPYILGIWSYTLFVEGDHHVTEAMTREEAFNEISVASMSRAFDLVLVSIPSSKPQMTDVIQAARRAMHDATKIIAIVPQKDTGEINYLASRCGANAVIKPDMFAQALFDWGYLRAAQLHQKVAVKA